ncbi:nitronate monooxygenase [Flavobacteriaceae bacterium R38]|nr:nitronate monooxygenase [Flavobacteriaceae bacterium R38]
MKTKLTELLGIKYPIIQAPIGSATNPVLASEVSNAGGLGMLALSWKSNEDCIRIIRETKKLTTQPFGVNLVLDWDQEERVDICISENVPVVSFFWGDSSKHIEKLKTHNIKVCQTVADSKEAEKYAALGVDFLIAQGWEAGGHVQGTVANSVLIPSIAWKVGIPVVAAGGFTNGQGLIASLVLGGSGISIGSRFLMSTEAHIEQGYADLIADANENDTFYTQDLFHLGWENAPHRVLKNSTIKEWEKAGKPPIGKRPNQGEVIAQDANGKSIYRYSDNNPIKGVTGNIEAMALYAGQSVGLLNKRIPSKEIIENIIEEAKQSIKFIGSLK